MNALERTIAFFAPHTALRRAQANLVLATINGQVERAYDGGKRGRRTEGWQTHATSANSEIGPALHLLRDRSRDLVRNNWAAQRAQTIWTANVVGDGIKPRASEPCIDLFSRWSEVCDADGQDDFYGLQALISDAEWESGEVLVRLRPRKLADNLPVPMQLQVLESDHLDTAKNEELKGGGYIRNGVQYNAFGRREGYWVFPTHPGDSMPFSRWSHTSRFVPADEILHIFRRRRPGQVRGIPQLASVMLKLRDLDDYQDAELLRKKIEACFVSFVTNVEGDATDEADVKKDGDKLVEMIEPGTTKYLPPGRDVKFGAPAATGGYGEYVRVEQHAVAAGSGVTYPQMTGDTSQSNYSSMRGEKLEFQRGVKLHQKRVLVHQACRPVWNTFNRFAVMSGALQKEERAKWALPKVDPVDPMKDAMADLILVRAGFRDLDQVIAEHGGDPREAIKTMQKIAEELDKAGLVLDSDPRRTSRVGVFQNALDMMNSDKKDDYDGEEK
jgi:lambda family phage portal protein